MSARFRGFPKGALKFLSALKKNNDRDWFQPRKAEFEEKLKEPMVELVIALGEHFEEFAPGMVIDPKKAIYRIYRDTRFSADKAPYKTHVAASFSPKALEKHISAGYYFHFSPDELLVGGGIWKPGTPELLAIRQRLSDRPDEYGALVSARPFKKYFGEVTGEKLKKAPKGFSPDDPAIELLKHKQFLAGDNLDPAIVETPKILPELAKRFRAMSPWIAWLNEPLVRAGR